MVSHSSPKSTQITIFSSPPPLRRTADGRALAKIQRTAPVTLTRLSRRARRWAAFLVEVLRIDYDFIDCTIDELSRHEFRVNGQTSSTRTTFRALAELEMVGALRRNRLRLGDNRFRVKIELCRDWFAWILKGRSYAGSSHISAPMPICPEVPRTDSDPSIPVTSLVSKEQTRDDKQTARREIGKKHRFHPVIYTLLKVLGGDKDKNRLVYRAEWELHKPQAATSGLDWSYYATTWQTLPIPHREQLAITQIIPALRLATEEPNNVVHMTTRKGPILEKTDRTYQGGKKIREYGPILDSKGILALFAAAGVGTVVGDGDARKEAAARSSLSDGGAGDGQKLSASSVDNFLSTEDFRILSEAREAARVKKIFLSK